MASEAIECLKQWRDWMDNNENVPQRLTPAVICRRVDAVIAAAEAESPAAHAAGQCREGELRDMLGLALPFVEDAERDPAYKPGVVSKLSRRIRAALEPMGPTPQDELLEAARYVLGRIERLQSIGSQERRLLADAIARATACESIAPAIAHEITPDPAFVELCKGYNVH